MKHLIICGTGAFARELYWHAMNSLGYGIEWDLKGFLDGPIKMDQNEYNKLQLPVLGVYTEYQPMPDDVFTCAIGTPSKRKDMIETVEQKGGNFISIIHKTAIVQGNAKLGKGIILCPNSLVNDNAVIGNYVMVNSMSSIAHDVSVGDYTCIMSHVDLNGFVQVGNECYFGSSVCVVPKSKIGDGAYIGAGSVVLRKVNSGLKVFGNPALPL